MKPIAVSLIYSAALMAQVAGPPKPESAFARKKFEAVTSVHELLAKVAPCLTTHPNAKPCRYGPNNPELTVIIAELCKSFYGSPTCDRQQLLIDVLKADIETLNQMQPLLANIKHADDCVRIYRTTIDKKVSELTGRDTEDIQMCKSGEQYPPQTK